LGKEKSAAIIIASILIFNAALVINQEAVVSIAAQTPIPSEGGFQEQETTSQQEGGPPEIVKRLNAPSEPTPLEESPNPPVITAEERLEMEEGVEETFETIEIPVTNTSIVGPDVAAKTQVNGSEAVGNLSLPINQSNLTNSQFLPEMDTSTLNNATEPTVDTGLTSSANQTNMSSITASPACFENPSQIEQTGNMTSLDSITGEETMLSCETIRIHQNTSVTLANIPSLVDEPSVASKDGVILYGGNWYVARSIDNGQTWRYIDPRTGMNYCCDIDLLYDPNNEIFIWYRQGLADRNNENIVRVGVSLDATNWWFYDIRPTDLNNQWTNQWFDYPHLVLGERYLYITTNIFSNIFERSAIMRLSLEDMRNQNAPEFSYYSDPSGRATTLTPVQGARDTMYWATHLSNEFMRIYEWNEAEPWTEINQYDRRIDAWTTIRRGLAQCAGPTDSNWCGRTDSRITAGWVSGNLVGFMWNAGAGGGTTLGATFNWPYINAATFDLTNNMAYYNRPYLWNNQFAWQYAHASPNNEGDIGIVAFYGGGAAYPSVAGGIDNNLTSRNGPFWFMTSAMEGTHGPAEPKWGDYVRIRQSGEDPSAWVASGFTLQGGSIATFIEPRYFMFIKEIVITNTTQNNFLPTAPSNNTMDPTSNMTILR
jgi:hypothetical protein